MKVVVYHANYDCDTGCCGHAVEVDGVQESFEFAHPWYEKTDEDRRAWAENLIRTELGDEHVKDLDWENSLVLDD